MSNVKFWKEVANGEYKIGVISKKEILETWGNTVDEKSKKISTILLQTWTPRY